MAAPKAMCLLGLALVSMVVATADDLKPSSLPTSLPPAKPGEPEDPYAFSSLQDHFDKLNQN